MGRKGEYSKEFKINIIKKYLNGEGAFELSLKDASYTKGFNEKVF